MIKKIIISLCIVPILLNHSYIISKHHYDYDKIVDWRLPAPDDKVLALSEDEYDDYLDYWLHQKFLKEIRIQERFINAQDGCVIPIISLTEPLPVFVRGSSLIKPDGMSGNIVFYPSEIVEVSCPGENNGLLDPTSSLHPSHGTLSCIGGISMKSSWIFKSEIDFETVHCLRRTTFTTIKTDAECPGGGVYINSTLQVGPQTYTVFRSCFSEASSKVIYVEYEQGPEHHFIQSKVERPRFNQGSHFPDLSVNYLYKQNTQKTTIDTILGPSMGEKFINSSFFLSRGHLAARTDFVLAPEQRSTFTFVNVAPQWQTFNGGNWNSLEQNLRSRISSGGYRTNVYTGTWDVLKLPDSSGNLTSIYLSPNNQRIPVPLWFFKVIHEPKTQRATAFLGLNNPYISLDEARKLAFCEDICADNSNFKWLTWKPTDVKRGFSMCCELSDFRETVTTLPPFTTNGIFS